VRLIEQKLQFLHYLLENKDKAAQNGTVTPLDVDRHHHMSTSDPMCEDVVLVPMSKVDFKATSQPHKSELVAMMSHDKRLLILQSTTHRK
jgi:hypothetical protein